MILIIEIKLNIAGVTPLLNRFIEEKIKYNDIRKGEIRRRGKLIFEDQNLGIDAKKNNILSSKILDIIYFRARFRSLIESVFLGPGLNIDDTSEQWSAILKFVEGLVEIFECELLNDWVDLVLVGEVQHILVSFFFKKSNNIKIDGVNNIFEE